MRFLIIYVFFLSIRSKLFILITVISYDKSNINIEHKKIVHLRFFLNFLRLAV